MISVGSVRLLDNHSYISQQAYPLEFTRPAFGSCNKILSPDLELNFGLQQNRLKSEMLDYLAPKLLTRTGKLGRPNVLVFSIIFVLIVGMSGLGKRRAIRPKHPG